MFTDVNQFLHIVLHHLKTLIKLINVYLNNHKNFNIITIR